MPLARLENFLKNLNGNTLYVDPNELDATDSIENRGNSKLRPFKTIQRALLEAARFSFVSGQNNDLFDQTTIEIAPGTHYIDNRPGFFVDADKTTIKNITGSTTSITEFSVATNFDINDANNQLRPFNSIHGGVIIPKGVSLVAKDLRKTKIRPKYVPDPANSSISASAIFRVTGGSYIFGFTIFDGDPLGTVYNTYTTNTVNSAYSHHKLTAFEYADGKNNYVRNGIDVGLTDLDMYYYKLALGYGNLSSRSIPNNYTDFQTNPEENKIVGDLGQGSINISSVIAGDGNLNITNIITVNTETEHNLTPLTPILISGVGSGDTEDIRLQFNGNFVVAQVISPTEFTYLLSEVPDTGNPLSANPEVKILSDTVSSSSPYIFNCSLKSVYGMNGLHADGSKATGFKSIVTAQFTGISLQKDDRAFVKYNSVTGTYQDQNQFGTSIFLHQDKDSVYKPDWENYHIKASNDAFIQCVSIFAIGYAKQFLATDGGDQSITNSNSNFGSVSLSSVGFKDYELAKDNHGFITHIIPPKEIGSVETTVRFYSVNIGLTTTRASDTGNYTRVYLAGYDDQFDLPPKSIRNYTIGARQSDKIYYLDGSGERSAFINPSYKEENVITNINSSSNVITLESSVSGISTGQSVRVLSNNGILPDGIEPHKVYYVHQDINYINKTIKLAENFDNAFSTNAFIDIQNTIGLTPTQNLKIVSKVSDRVPGDIGHPIQWDDTYKNWYINIVSNQTFIEEFEDLDASTIYIKRLTDNRSSSDKSYRVRLVIPKEAENASDPTSGFVLQRSSSPLSTNFFSSSDLSSPSEVRNTNNIVDAWYDSGTASIVTAKPHKLKVNNTVKIYNLKSSNEPSPVGLGTGTGFNGSFVVTSIVDDLTFTYGIDRDPGTITTVGGATQTWLDLRDCNSSNVRVAPYTILSANRLNLPYFTCEQVSNAHQIYKIETIQKYSEGSKDGIYHITLNSFKNKPYTAPFDLDTYKLSQNLDYLYPKVDLDNPISDPDSTHSVASRSVLGKVDVNNLELSVTKESVVQFLNDFGLVYEITQIQKSGSNCTLTLNENHNINGVKSVSISSGSGYTNGTYYDIPLCGGDGRGATCNVVVSGGEVTSVTIATPGSGYRLGNVMSIKGIPGSTSLTTVAVNNLNTINGEVFDSIQVFGSIYPSNNGVFKIIEVSANTIIYENVSGVTETSSNASLLIANPSFPIISLSYSGATDSTTVTINTVYNQSHTFISGNKVIFDGVAGVFKVSTVNSSTEFVVEGNASGATKCYGYGISSSTKDSNSRSENLSTRQFSLYGGYSSKCTSIISVTSASFSVPSTLGLSKGDFVQVNDEIMFITDISGSGVDVLRGVLSTKVSSHSLGSFVRKISVIPVELRRSSILRASGHTFEYTGFGPGNYSTGMPTNQEKVLTNDQTLISQALPTKGGLVVYTGMNSNGEFFIGRKKFDATTGEEISLSSVIEEESDPLNFFDDLTVNKLTVNREIDADTAKARFKEIEVINGSTFNGDVIIKSFTDSTNYENGALVVSGGVGIGKSLNVSGPITAERFIKNGATSTNFLKAGGDDALLTGSEVVNALGYTPANAASISVSNLPVGNSFVCDQLTFNGGTDFTLRINGTPFIPVGNAANLIVSLGGVIQRPGTDFIIVESPPGTNTSTIRFTTAPPSGASHFIVALGGQGSLTLNVDWNTKGQIPVAVTDNNAMLLNVSGNDGYVLTEDSTAASGVAWKSAATSFASDFVGTSGYQKFPGGFTIQWGRSSFLGQQPQTQTFSIPFTSTVFSVVATPNYDNPPAGDKRDHWSVDSFTLSNFRLNSWFENKTVTYNWIAIGV
jgi:hypothetical protein